MLNLPKQPGFVENQKLLRWQRIANHVEQTSGGAVACHTGFSLWIGLLFLPQLA
jgi:hypothetical protein